MDKWAVKYFGHATFVCVGCDGAGLATTFANRLQLTKCTLTITNEISSTSADSMSQKKDSTADGIVSMWLRTARTSRLSAT